ncbi:cation:proton antiporter [Sphingomonas sabuli]|uniref:Cation:proton antiporter n=1 Tax=Sphingomonas sabuli TaxID=2764186 RepID=A0A7G9L219_9SPHN|nr:cation:proton antiporter [Sphingomonas sabuli]QNM82668.1 cation:proton antiporter [Sphingomonas sabuli]
MSEIPFMTIGLLLLVASLIAIGTRRIGLPYSVGLVAAGLAIAMIPDTPELPLSRELIFNVFLPPLVFEAALQLNWKKFRRELPVTLLLSFGGVAIATAVVAAGMHYLAGWSWIGAALFGTLIAATDPVAVIAAFKEMHAEKRLAIVVESESLLNDGVVAVAFAVLAGIAAGAPAEAATIVPEFAWTLIGGVLIGGAVAGAILLIAGRTRDHLVEITLTAITAYSSFLIAEHFHASGVLASLTAGLVVGNIGWMGAISDEGRPHVLASWEFFAFLANSFVFILIGMHEATQPIGLVSLQVASLAIGLVLIGRLLAIYPLAAVFAPTRLKLSLPYQHVLFWGGLKGALALALALALPANVPERMEIVVTAFIVVAFSIFIQGLTMPGLIRRLHLTRGSADPAEAASTETYEP